MKNRKLVALLLSGVMAVSTLAGCGSTDTSKDSSATKDSTAGSTAQVSSEYHILFIERRCNSICLNQSLCTSLLPASPFYEVSPRGCSPLPLLF